MPFEAKSLVPSGHDLDALNDAFEDAASGGITVLEAPAGCVLTEGLALAFTRLGRHPLWLRLGPEDRDPGTFLVSLVAAARRLHHDVGQATRELMRAQPGPVFGWSPLFAQLARELSSCISERGALVLEHVHHAWTGSPTFSLVTAHLLPTLDGVAPCVLIAYPSPPAEALRDCAWRPTRGLGIPQPAIERALEECAPSLTRRVRDRALALIAGRASVLAALRDVRATAGPDCVERVLRRVANREELLTHVAGTLLADAGIEARRTLGLAVRLEYAHPAMAAAAVGGGQLPPWPWLQRLEDGWARVRTCWRAPLWAALGRGAAPSRDALHRAADWLRGCGAEEHAISLYLEIGDAECAARAISCQASSLIDLGQWTTLEGWLAQLPDDVLASYPNLLCDRADIAAAYGHTAAAQQWFDIAASQCAKRNDVEGACRSLLAGSAVAADVGDLATALSRARAASSLAGKDDLGAIRMWASWQHGRVALVAGDTDGALASFCHAASAAGRSREAAAAQPVRIAGQLAMRIGELRRQQELHREAQAALKHAEHEALNQLLASVRMPGRQSSKMIGDFGWSRAPVPLKLPGLGNPDDKAAVRKRRSLVRLRAALPRSRRAGVPLPADSLNGQTAELGEPASCAHLAATTSHPMPQGTPELAVHLLGPLCAAINDVPVEDWPSARCRSLFGYLLTHRQPWPPREVLMEMFWPESSPDASRNSLNVAIYGLRQTLRAVTDLPVIMHTGGAYRIHPGLRLWLDVEEFDSRVESGRRLEKAGDLDKAMREYEFADGLYRGDFFAEDPYEDWAALTRERLRLAHLDALGRLSNLHFNARRYAACAGLCQRIIERDPCREDAHRLLMRCYSRQGHLHLALMQYRACVRALADELGVKADPATSALHERIRRHEPV